MADITNATDVAVGAGGLGKTIAAAIIQFNKAAVMPSTISMTAAVKGSNTVQFPLYSKVAASAVTEESTGTEGTEVDATAITSTAASVEILRNHINAKVTDLAAFGNSDALMVNAGQIVGNAVATKFDKDLIARFADFATVRGTATDGLKFLDIMDALASLEENDAPRPYSAVLHPLQMYGSYGLSNEFGSTAVQGSNAAFNGLAGSGGVADQFMGSGFVTSIAGINFYTSSQVAATSDQHIGGVFAKTALGCGFMDFGGGNFIQLATERNELGAQTNIVANAYYGHRELVDLHGVELTTETSTA